MTYSDLAHDLPQNFQRINLPHPLNVVPVVPHQLHEKLRPLLAGGGDAGKLVVAGVEQGEHQLRLVFVQVFGMPGVATGKAAGLEVEKWSGFAPGAGGQQAEVGRQLQQKMQVKVGDRAGGGVEQFKGLEEEVEKSFVLFRFPDGVAGHLKHKQPHGAAVYVERDLGVYVGRAYLLEPRQIFALPLVGDDVDEVHWLDEAGRRPAACLAHATDDVLPDAFGFGVGFQDEAGVAVFGGSEDKGSGL